MMWSCYNQFVGDRNCINILCMVVAPSAGDQVVMVLVSLVIG